MDFPLALAAQMSPQLRSLRKAKNLTQVQLAQLMGVAQSRIAAIERDATKLTLQQLMKLLALLDAELVVRPRFMYETTHASVHKVNEPGQVPGLPDMPDGLDIPKGEW